ncbi:MAG: hypothetical protein KJ601_06905 [Nanoarchaeota archaeon]|nr:hypothetical protein [Nanoarchaeota archaeon]MBU1704072.1 hypothetical protein [Nanoarchaeota archaeon]
MIEEIDELNDMIYYFQEQAILKENKRLIAQLERNGVKIRVQLPNPEAS